MKQFKTPVLMLLIFTVLTGIIYPALVTGAGYLFFPYKINGSLITKNGSVTGSELIGQKFTSAQYFHGRPSAADYDSSASGGSNLGPSNKKLIAEVKERVSRIRKEFNLSENSHIPSDMLFSSGSGLDPNISTESAYLQAERISTVRKIDRSLVEKIIVSNTDKQLFMYGISFVNVLKLNSDLDRTGEKK